MGNPDGVSSNFLRVFTFAPLPAAGHHRPSLLYMVTFYLATRTRSQECESFQPQQLI